MNNNNNLHSDDEDSKDISIEEVNVDQNSANRIANKEENDDDELCRCGDPNSHKDECSLYCGLAPCEEKMVKFPKCIHYIHETCLDQLLYTRLSKCPLCRSSIESWRRSHHYHEIEREISHQFQSDTERAIRLSQKMYEQEQNKENANRQSRSGNRDSDESETRNRERSRSRERNNGEGSDRNNREGSDRHNRESHRHSNNRNRNHGHRERYDRNNNYRRNRSQNRNDRNFSRYFT